MVGMSTFVDALHPRGMAGRFVSKSNEAPVTQLSEDSDAWLPAGDGCTCLVNPRPFSHYGAVEPGDALEPDPDCPAHFPVADDDEWVARNEEWAADAVAGVAPEPDQSAGSASAWASVAIPF